MRFLNFSYKFLSTYERKMVQEFHGVPLGLRLRIPIGVVEGAKLGESEAISVGLSEVAAKGIKLGAVERDGATEMDGAVLGKGVTMSIIGTIVPQIVVISTVPSIHSKL